MQRRAMIAAGGACLLALALGGTWLATTGPLAPDDPFVACRGEDGPAAVPAGLPALSAEAPLGLVSETGEAIAVSEALGGFSLVYFGYTFCPDICPIDAMRNALAVEEATAEAAEPVLPVFITIDPDRDTPEVLARFTDNFHDRMLGLTGSAEEISQVAEAFGVAYARDPGEEAFYTMSHTALSYIMLPGGRVADIVRREESPSALAARLVCFTNLREVDLRSN
ncbi:SCO family protein [Pseudoroseicyclus sp. CXY001]|uniref:SCO family protein n=1 Tax=Pseudoroseicyclus sp. CXY001 TaxID=3242492 RepID=UPI003570F0EA